MFRLEIVQLKGEYKNRFRNISRLIDCVGCDKCQLWGKVPTQGYKTTSDCPRGMQAGFDEIVSSNQSQIVLDQHVPESFQTSQDSVKHVRTGQVPGTILPGTADAASSYGIRFDLTFRF